MLFTGDPIAGLSMLLSARIVSVPVIFGRKAPHLHSRAVLWIASEDDEVTKDCV